MKFYSFATLTDCSHVQGPRQQDFGDNMFGQYGSPRGQGRHSMPGNFRNGDRGHSDPRNKQQQQHQLQNGTAKEKEESLTENRIFPLERPSPMFPNAKWFCRLCHQHFNQMVTALERMMTSQQRLLSDISHELRTPLTRLQLGTALLRRRSGESKELERIETEAQRLDSMINDLLVMSRNQQKNALVSETIKANQLWSEVLDNAAFEAEQMGKSLTVNFPPGPWPLYGNPNALESALENIVRNALRYSHTKIEVGFAVDKDGITITVDDDGPGVSPEDREQIFRPFYRTDEARDRESGGTGLGLAIVETAIQQHRGWVKAEDSPLGGLRLVIWLPLYKRS